MRRTPFIFVTLLLAILLTLVACTPSSTTTTSQPFSPPLSETSTKSPAPAPTAIEVTAQELYSDYEANQVAADAKYDGKTLIVTGVIESIGKDILDTPYITLTNGGKYEVWGIQCMFDEKHGPELAQLTKGQKAAVQGKCDGYLVNILLRDCTLIFSAPTPAIAPAPALETPPAPPVSTPPEPEPTPTQTPFEPIVLTGSGGKTTPPFTVTTEEWIVDWSYTSDNPEFAIFSFFIYPRGETMSYVESCLFTEETSGSTYSYAGAGEYYIQVEAGNIKTWIITIKPAV